MLSLKKIVVIVLVERPPHATIGKQLLDIDDNNRKW